MPLISIIVPVYNVEKYLERCVRSILTQSFSDFELILVDDGSLDNSGILCDQYAQKDSRVKVVHQDNAGLSAARNTGIDWAIQNSTSEWLTFIDSDDWVYSDYLRLLLNNALSFKADLVCCDFIRTKGDTPEIDKGNLKGKVVDAEDFYINNNVVATVAVGKLYNKKNFMNIRYPIGKLHEDEYTTYKVLFNVNKVVYIDLPMYFYYQNPNSIMQSSWNPKRLDVIGAFEQQIIFFENKPHIRNIQIKRYIVCLYNYLCTLEKMVEYPECQKEIKNRLKRLLINYYKEVKWKDIPYIAEKVFPRFMKYYWFFLAQLNKFRR